VTFIFNDDDYKDDYMEQMAHPTGDGKPKFVKIPKREFVKEHTHLIDLLKKGSRAKLKKEATIQAKELEKMGGKKPCWKGYEQFGMKKKDGRSVPNCVPKGGSKSLNDLYKQSQN
jgi:hypothetical protein